MYLGESFGQSFPSLLDGIAAIRSTQATSSDTTRFLEAAALRLHGWAVTLMGQSHFEEAATLAEHALWASRHAHGERHEDTVSVMGVLGAALAAQGKHGDAEVHQTTALLVSRETLGDHHTTTRVAKHALVMTPIFSYERGRQQ